MTLRAHRLCFSPSWEKVNLKCPALPCILTKGFYTYRCSMSQRSLGSLSSHSLFLTGPCPCTSRKLIAFLFASFSEDRIHDKGELLRHNCSSCPAADEGKVACESAVQWLQVALETCAWISWDGAKSWRCGVAISCLDISNLFTYNGVGRVEVGVYVAKYFVYMPYLQELKYHP